MKFERVVMVVKVGVWLSMTKGERLNLLQQLVMEGINYGNGAVGIKDV